MEKLNQSSPDKHAGHDKKNKTALHMRELILAASLGLAAVACGDKDEGVNIIPDAQCTDTDSDVDTIQKNILKQLLDSLAIKITPEELEKLDTSLVSIAEEAQKKDSNFQKLDAALKEALGGKFDIEYDLNLLISIEQADSKKIDLFIAKLKKEKKKPKLIKKFLIKLKEGKLKGEEEEGKKQEKEKKNGMTEKEFRKMVERDFKLKQEESKQLWEMLANGANKLNLILILSYLLWYRRKINQASNSLAEGENVHIAEQMENAEDIAEQMENIINQ